MTDHQVLVLPRYTAAGPSSRVRFFQYLPALQKAGFNCHISPFFDEEYIQSLFSNKSPSKMRILNAYTRRIAISLTSQRYDLVWMQYELLPWLAHGFEKMLLRGRPKLVVDYDDAVFHRYDLQPNKWVAHFLGDKIARGMRAADMVVVGNTYLENYARKAGAQKTVVIPSVVDTGIYQPAGSATVKKGLTIGWIGTPVTVRYLEALAPVLEKVLVDDTRLTLVGAQVPESLRRLPVDSLPWHADEEITAIQSFDVGIMPLPDEPFERGKCGYKLIQYMACRLPVVASPVGANKVIVDEGSDGFLPQTQEDWISALSRLLEDKALRARMGAAGRACKGRAAL